MNPLSAIARRWHAATSLASPLRAERTLVVLLTAIQFTLILDFMLLMPLGPQFVQQMGLSVTEFGLAVSVYTWCSALAGFTAPLWLPRVRTTLALLVLYGAFAAGTVACGLATSPFGLLLARALTGGASGLVWSLVLATVVERIAREHRGKALGAVMTSYALSAVLGVPVGLFLAQRYGCRLPFIGLSAVATVLLVLLRTLFRSMGSSQRITEPPQAYSRDLLSSPLVLGWLLTFSVVFSGFLLIPYLGLHLEVTWGLRRDDVALVYACGGLCSLVTSRVVGWACDRAGAARTLGVLMCATILTHAAMAHVQSTSKWLAIVVFVAFMTTTSGRMIPVVDLLTEGVPARIRTAYLAVNTGMTDVSSGLASIVAGNLLGSRMQDFPQRFAGLGYGSVVATCLSLGILASLVRLRGSRPEYEVAQ